MLNFKRILLATDFSETADQALRYAVFLTNLYAAELIVFHVVEYKVSYFFDHEPDLEELDGRVKERFKEALAVHGIDHAKVQTIIRRAPSASDAIVDLIKEKEIDLLVMGSYGRRTMRTRLMGSVAQEVTRLANCPVLNVRNYPSLEVTLPPKRILVPLDLSEQNKKAVEWTQSIATQTDVQVDLLHVREQIPVPGPYVIGGEPKSDLMPEMRGRIESDMMSMFDGAAALQKLNTYVEEGSAATTIIDFAQKKEADLIVLTSHGQTAFERFFMGSVADKVIQLATCPVLLIHSFPK